MINMHELKSKNEDMKYVIINMLINIEIWNVYIKI